MNANKRTGKLTELRGDVHILRLFQSLAAVACLQVGARRRLAAKILAAVILCLAAPAGAQEERRFGDWTAHCEVDDLCRAVVGQGPVLMLERYPRETYWELSLDLAPSAAGLGTPFGVSVDGSNETFDWSEIRPYGGPTRYYFLSAKAQGLLDAMILGESVTVRYSGEEAMEQTAEFSLSGLSAALLWIDERQGRVGSERVTGEPPYGLLPAGFEVDPNLFVPAELVEAHRADEDCEPFEDLANGGDSIVARLDDDKTVALLPCWAGAYNFSAKVYVIEGQTFTRQHFAQYSDYTSWSSTDALVNAWYDPETGEIGTFNKGRGIADCGSSGLWRWAGDYFRLEEFRYKGECDESGEPGDFPVVYTAKPLPED